MSGSWKIELDADEERVLRLCKKRPLWRFLREQRHALFDETVVASLNAMYSKTARGRPPKNAQVKAMAMVLQVAFDVPDHEVPTLTAVDQRWQVVLGCVGATKPVIAQGTVFDFRMRAISEGFASVLLERTVELARETKGFSARRLRALIDSSPLLGAGRVEDTFNLIGRAIAQLAKAAAVEAKLPLDHVIDEAGISMVSASSVKAWLDFDWNDKSARVDALQRLIGQFAALRTWLQTTLGAERMKAPPVGPQLALVERLIAQDLEPEPDDPSGTRYRVRQGTTADRQISLSDPDIRHGRKSKSKAFNGYKRHVLVDADIRGLIHATTVVAANVKEHQPLAGLLKRVEAKGFSLEEVHVDRGYLPSEDLTRRRRAGLEVFTKAPADNNGTLFPKSAFTIDLTANTITCPATVTVPIASNKNRTTSFPAKTCATCSLESNCTKSKRGRSIRLHPSEAYHQQLRAGAKTSKGRQRARERIAVEHALARVSQIQGKRARFHGLAKNKFDLERAAIVNNCYVVASIIRAA